MPIKFSYHKYFLQRGEQPEVFCHNGPRPRIWETSQTCPVCFVFFLILIFIFIHLDINHTKVVFILLPSYSQKQPWTSLKHLQNIPHMIDCASCRPNHLLSYSQTKYSQHPHKIRSTLQAKPPALVDLLLPHIPLLPQHTWRGDLEVLYNGLVHGTSNKYCPWYINS